MEYGVLNGAIEDTFIKDLNIVIKNSKLGKGVKLYPNVCLKECVLGDNVCVEENSYLTKAKIGDFSVVTSSFVENSSVGKNCTVGPFAHIRDNSAVGDGCRVGNFVEIKNSLIGNDCKMAHLAYIGDVTMGNNCNIGCGVVFCNFNGKIKQRSTLKDNVFVGSNVNIIAPLTIGNDVFIAAGSTLDKDVPDNNFVIARARQENKLKK